MYSQTATSCACKPRHNPFLHGYPQCTGILRSILGGRQGSAQTRPYLTKNIEKLDKKWPENIEGFKMG